MSQALVICGEVEALDEVKERQGTRNKDAIQRRFNVCRVASKRVDSLEPLSLDVYDHRSQVARQQSTLCKGIGCTIASDGGCLVADGSIHQPSLQDTASKGADLTEGTRLCQLGADYFETLRGDQNYLSWTWSAHWLSDHRPTDI
ncbi:hypothetical protein BASA50_006465 [Batrachochytrium salamandrivorans]|uniref:Uncharacterized protein n=1 Tax=Batrachochytrium salamandrivorans TaxID=1357716 RepID=A0ABQ8FAT2_9FUNG|nr:hypothetical protein BASA50_006465 [Batrachochytrium salamandrivorans]